MYAANDKSLDADMDDPQLRGEAELFRLRSATSRSVEFRLRPEEEWEGPGAEDEAAAAERKLLVDIKLSLPVGEATERSLRVPPLLPISMDLGSTSCTPLRDPRATLMGHRVRASRVQHVPDHRWGV